MFFHNHTFFFIKYPIASGGSHLQNLISLDNNFLPSNLDNNHESFNFYLKNFYENLQPYGQVPLSDKHVSNHYLINQKKFDSVVEEIKNHKINFTHSVHKGHHCSFIERKNFIDNLQNKKFILVYFEDEKDYEIAIKRELKMFRTTTLKQLVYREEIRYNYDCIFCNHEKVNDDIIKIKISDLFSKNIDTILDNINQKFGCNIPIATAKYYHYIWLEKNGIK